MSESVNNKHTHKTKKTTAQSSCINIKRDMSCSKNKNVAISASKNRLTVTLAKINTLVG